MPCPAENHRQASLLSFNDIYEWSSTFRLILDARTLSSRRWLFYIELIRNVSGERGCYVQIVEAIGSARYELFCLPGVPGDNPFGGRVHWGAQVAIESDPDEPDLLICSIAAGADVQLVLRSNPSGLAIAGRLDTLKFDLRSSSGLSTGGYISTGTASDTLLTIKTWTSSDEYPGPPVIAAQHGVLIPSSGRWQDTDQLLNVQALEHWTSGLTFESYPTKLTVDAPSASLTISAIVPMSESVVLYEGCPRWLGLCELQGEVDSKSVDEIGLFICTRKALVPVDAFLERVNGYAHRAIERILPNGTDLPDVQALFGCREYDDLCIDAFPAQCLPPVLSPLRDIIERGGQLWRGVTVALCSELVGTPFDACSDWLVFGEVLHTGALIIDDVQDGSPIRRGGAACHEIHGVATAINSGSLAYFIVQQIIERSGLTVEQKAAVYGEYIDLIRVAHIGQGIDHQLDIDTLTDEPTADELRSISAKIHYCDLLKSGMPFRTYARIGGIIGQGTAQQVAALGSFFQCLGSAFQTVDDALDLVGLRDDDPKRGDDLRRGKTTLPVISALNSVSGEQRARLIRDIRRAKNNGPVALQVAQEIVEMGVPQRCRDQAHDSLQEAFSRLQQNFPDSIGMNIVRELSDIILMRHY